MRKLLIAAALVLAALAAASGEVRAYSPKHTTLQYVEIGAADLTLAFGNLTVRIGERIDPDAVMAELRRLGLSFESKDAGFGNEPYELPAVEIRGLGFRILFLAETDLLVSVYSNKKDWELGNGLSPGDTVYELRLRFLELSDDPDCVLYVVSPSFEAWKDMIADTRFFFWLSFLCLDGVVHDITVQLDEYAP